MSHAALGLALCNKFSTATRLAFTSFLHVFSRQRACILRRFIRSATPLDFLVSAPTFKVPSRTGFFIQRRSVLRNPRMPTTEFERGFYASLPVGVLAVTPNLQRLLIMVCDDVTIASTLRNTNVLLQLNR